MLSYDDELRLSDLIVERYSVVTSLKDEGREPSSSEQDVIDRGDKAISELVEHYLPRVYSLASVVTSKTTRQADDLYAELVQIGVEAAMKVARSFNCRGKDGRKGLRFGSYSTQTITKAMYRYIAMQSTPYKLDISVIQMSWKWRAVEQDLKAELGRAPTDDEIEERANISQEFVKDFPVRSDFIDVDDPEAPSVADSQEHVIELDSEYDSDAATLRQVFEQVFNEEICDELSSYLGLDRMMPRTVDEFAQHSGLGKVVAKRRATYLEDLISHPKWRISLKRAINEMDNREEHQDDGSKT